MPSQCSVEGGFKLGVFGNFVDTDAPNLLQIDASTGRPVQLNFTTQTYDAEIGYTRVVGGNHILSMGGNARRNNFDITIAPASEDRNEFGAYLQDEIFWDKFRVALGARVGERERVDRGALHRLHREPPELGDRAVSHRQDGSAGPRVAASTARRRRWRHRRGRRSRSPARRP